MANVITLLFVDLAAMLDVAAVATQAAQVEWDKHAQGGTKPPVLWEQDAIREGLISLVNGLKHKKKEYWDAKNRAVAHDQATRVGTLAAQKAKSNGHTSIWRKDLKDALDDIFVQRPEEPCPF